MPAAHHLEAHRPPESGEGVAEIALRFDGDQLTVVAQTGLVQLGAAAMRPGEDRVVARDVEVQIGGARLTLCVGEGWADERSSAEITEPPSEVVLDFLPRGGQLRMRWQGREMTTYLGDRRCDLAAVLLQPPAPHVAGELVPDELITARVWPTAPRSRNDLNTLVYRLRKTLARMSPAAARLVTRAQGGRGTRFCVAPTTRIAVR